MTNDERCALGEIIKQLGKFAAERRALITILDESGVVNWNSRLEELRATPQYQLIAFRYEAVHRQMEVDANFEVLARLLQQIDEGKPLN